MVSILWSSEKMFKPQTCTAIILPSRKQAAEKIYLHLRGIFFMLIIDA